MVPDLAVCTNPTSFAQSRGNDKSRMRRSTPGFAAGAAAASAVFFFFAPNDNYSPQTEQVAVISYTLSCQRIDCYGSNA